MNDWKPIQTEPPEDTWLLMCDKYGNRWTGIYPEHDEECGYPATHWMILPEPPR